MSADDATATDPLAHDAEPTHRTKHTTENGTSVRSSGHTRQTAAYWSMQRTMTDLS